ncbi:hypothetical protein [Rhodococcus sp. AG1013]|uniref:hypothetical protein n=1 Tax=unclassified Rhodococcus (in: high G+C Gram-positive bacteria) TaxID=192944 RepID=UPI000E2AA750|nr:hypothetical protein [Rhodococcus sp. AG1013]RDI35876.1 hypothetical protein DEU38_101356 [Rhodococcus sp. AG1013]
MVGVAVGNLVRIVFLSFETHQGIGTYALALLLGLVVSAIWGAVVGLIVGGVQALDARIRQTVEPTVARRTRRPAKAAAR